MARTKRRIYSTTFMDSTTAFPPSVGTGIVASHHAAPHDLHETFLRSRMEAQLSVDVNAPGFDIPPEFWWTQTYVWVSAFWVPSNTTVHQPTDGTSVDYLGSMQLRPQRFPLETNAGEYAIIWTTTEPMITETARKATTNSTAPNVLFQIDAHDPQFVLSGFWTDVSVNVYMRNFTLWEDPT